MEGTPFVALEQDVAIETTSRPLEVMVGLAMSMCRVLDRKQGCSWEDKLCDDEIGVETDCPGQALRVYRRNLLTDENIDI
jgi:hypothetical protein